MLDATKEDKDVFIKRVDITTHPNEVKIASRLGSTESRKDGRNHCVPIISILSDELDTRYQYIVMPVLRPFNEPDFTSVGEVIEFVDQTLEVSIAALPYVHAQYHVQGLEYIHEQNVAHRWVASMLMV